MVPPGAPQLMGQRWHFVELAESWTLPPATGTAPGPAELPVPPTGSHPLPRAVPAPLCATEPQGCCCCSTAPKRAPGGAEERVEAQGGPPAPTQVAVQPQGSPGSRRPRRVSRSGCCSRRGSGRCIWSHPRPSSAGCRGWAGVGTWGTGRGVLSVCPPSAQAWATWGQAQSIHRVRECP